MQHRFDHHVIKLARDGDDGALNALAEEVIPVVLGWCMRLGNRLVDPEDAAHDVLVVMVDKLPTLREPKAFGGWLFQITRKVLSSHRRKEQIRAWMPWTSDHQSSDPDAEAMAWNNELAAAIRGSLDQLPGDQREALVLCDIEEHTDPEAAEILNIPVGTLKSRLRLGRKKFREQLERRSIRLDELHTAEAL